MPKPKLPKKAAAPAAKKAEAPKAAETTTDAPVETTPTPAPAKKAAAAPKMGDMIMVSPVKGDMHEPFQNIRIQMGEKTKVQLTSWVQSQLAAKLLIIV